MGYKSLYKGIVFIEGDDSAARLLGDVACDLSFRPGAQLKSLNDVKEELAQASASLGGNAVVRFTYGQKARLLAWDDVAFWGKGAAAFLPAETYNAYVAYIQERDGASR